jgi:hypothetical protein
MQTLRYAIPRVEDGHLWLLFEKRLERIARLIRGVLLVCFRHEPFQGFANVRLVDVVTTSVTFEANFAEPGSFQRVHYILMFCRRQPFEHLVCRNETPAPWPEATTPG